VPPAKIFECFDLPRNHAIGVKKLTVSGNFLRNLVKQVQHVLARIVGDPQAQYSIQGRVQKGRKALEYDSGAFGFHLESSLIESH
jgi:hypothetical protein